jgi:hypothetical protein
MGEPIGKTPKVKRAGDMVVCLLGKCKALSSNPDTNKTKPKTN